MRLDKADDASLVDLIESIDVLRAIRVFIPGYGARITLSEYRRTISLSSDRR
jgi:hypothetical protein